MIRTLRRHRWILAAGIIGLGPGSAAFGQGNTFNPFGNSGYADYREFTLPIANGDPTLPGQARLQSGLVGRGGANQFEAYTNSLDGADGEGAGSRGGSVSGVPYYRASRFYGTDDRRAYRANAGTDREFQDRVAQRNAAYNQALKEKDPRKRALLIQKIERDALDRPAAATKGAAQPKTARPLAAQAGQAAAPAAARRTPAAAPRTAAPGNAAVPRAAAPAATDVVNPAAPGIAPVPIPPPR